MARVTKQRKEEIKKFEQRWSDYAEIHRMERVKVSPLLFYVALSIIRELLGE